jgi:hypothetical protein
MIFDRTKLSTSQVTTQTLKNSLRYKVVMTAIAVTMVFIATWLYLNFGTAPDTFGTSTTMTAVTDGNWTAPTTWSGGRVPRSNDIIVVPTGKTVTVDVVTKTYTNMYVKVYGTMNFANGKKLTMCPGALHVYPGGTLNAEANGSKINICTDMPWSGNDVSTGPLHFGDYTLPATFLNFNGTRTGSTVTLNWTTEYETANSTITIQRSTDNTTWTDIKTVTSTGDGVNTQSYTEIDENPQVSNNYYRITLTSPTGNTITSRTVYVRFSLVTGSSGTLTINTIGPNPFTGNFTVNYDATDAGTVVIQLVNTRGTIVWNQTSPVTKGANTFTFNDGSALENDIYYLQMVMNGQIQSQKIIKR